MENFFDMKYADVVAGVKRLESGGAGGTPIRIAFVRNITLDPVLPYLKYLCLGENISPQIHVCEFDTAMNDALDAGGALYASAPDVVVAALTLDLLSPKIAHAFASLSPGEAEAEADKAAGYFEGLIGALRRNTNATLIVHSVRTPAWPSHGVLDTPAASYQSATIREINSRISAAAAEAGNCHVLWLDNIVARVGEPAFLDPRMWHIGKIPYSRDGFRMLAAEYMKYVRARLGKNKKCLVLDCDNTLWGGIVGEDGVGGIKLGGTFPGSSYRDFQLAVLNLHHRGVILAICSKNNEADVVEVFEKHPECALRMEHFAAVRANWLDKPANIASIAAELNIGTDSMVFVDDSEMEISLMREARPEVVSILLNGDASRYAAMLNSLGLFDTLAVSEEDGRRTEMYRAEASRKTAMAAATDLESYLKSLDIEITISSADEFSLPRIAQLILKTNQFNLTTKRYSESEAAAFASGTDSELLYLHYRDKFGDMGIVGAAIILFHADRSEIDTLLLSCRALGRHAEDAFLEHIVAHCRKRGSAPVTAAYSPTEKNKQTADFYTKRGFKHTGTDGEAQLFTLAADDAPPLAPQVFKSINTTNIGRKA